jgi:DNA-binding NarL/FixJ family response regulator
MAWKRIWEGLLRWRAPPPSRAQQRPEPSEDDLLAPLRRLAQDQGRSLDEVTYDLLAHSLAQQPHTPPSERLWMALTPREQDVAALIYAGYNNTHVASLLDLSVETVRSHVRHILYKGDLHSKIELCLVLEHEGSDLLARRRLEKLLNLPQSPAG